MFDYKHAVIYQLWPRSFYDSNHDGIGDINGIRAKLPHIRSLHCDAIWLSPVYASPNDDFGYDISDYCSINPEFGTMEDLEALIQEADALGMKIIMDLVVNHTSTSHAWFQKALKNPSSPYRDYYIFRKGTETQAPNNWISFFGGSAWQKAEQDMWYMTLYTKTQADLNWTNPAVIDEIVKITDFWLEKGIAGFRMDTINTIDKIEGLPSKNPEKKGLQFADDYVIDRPNVRPYLQQLRDRSLSRYDSFALGEGVMTTEASVRNLCGPDGPLDMMFHFDLATLGYGALGKYDFRKGYIITDRMIKKVTRKWQQEQMRDHTWIGNYLSNHDHKRHLDRFGNDRKYRVVSAKMLALYNFTLIGTPLIYQGEEIGMTNPKLKKSDWRDYEAFSSSKEMTNMLHVPAFLAEKITNFVDRDNARTPVQWNSHQYAGFSDHEPWICVNPDYLEWNVESQEKQSDSILNFYRTISRIHHEHECLVTGSWSELLETHPHVLAYLRKGEAETALVVLNLSGFCQKIKLPDACVSNVQSALSNYETRTIEAQMRLKPYEAHLWFLNEN